MNKRYHGLDFARACLMLLVIPYHSSLIYKVGGGWRLAYEEQSYVFNQLAFFLHSFRNAAFYIIAGFFFVMLIEKYGTRKALSKRVLRIGLPLLSVGFTLNFLVNAFSQDREFALSIDYLIRGQWLGHLWFLGNLLIYYFLALSFSDRFAAKNTRPASIKEIALVALLLTPVSSVLATLFGYQIYSEQFLFITFGTLYKYFPYFVLGMYLWGQRSVIFDFMTTRNCAILFSFSVVCQVLINGTGFSDLGWQLVFLASSVNAACLAVSAVFILNSIGNRKSKLVTKLTNSSYSIYLLHYPLIVCVYVLVLADAGINLYASFLVLCTVVFLISYITHYAVFEKSPYLMLVFNGKSLARGEGKLLETAPKPITALAD